MSKSIEIFETPDSCLDCSYHYKYDELTVGEFTHKSLFRCRKEPKFEDYEEQEKFNPYINEYMLTNCRAPWCTLRILTNEEEKKLKKILGELEVIYYGREN